MNLIYADMSGYFFQDAYWDTVLQLGHFGNRLTLAQLQALDGDSFAVLGDPTTNTWQLTTGAYALGHYSRWVLPGDVRVDAASDNPLEGASGCDSDTVRVDGQRTEGEPANTSAGEFSAAAQSFRSGPARRARLIQDPRNGGGSEWIADGAGYCAAAARWRGPTAAPKTE